MPCDARSRSPSSGASGSTDSAWLTMSSSRPRYSSSRTWLIGSRRAPNFDVVLRTPLATARTLPCSSVSSTTMRSASPSLYVPQHDAGVAIEAPLTVVSRPPNRRRRPWKSSMAATQVVRAASSPNGTGRNTSSP